MTKQELQELINESVTIAILENDVYSNNILEEDVDELYLEQCEQIEDVLYESYIDTVIEESYITEKRAINKLIDKGGIDRKSYLDLSALNFNRQEDKKDLKLITDIMSHQDKEKYLKFLLKKYNKSASPEEFESLLKEMVPPPDQMKQAEKEQNKSIEIYKNNIKAENELRKKIGAPQITDDSEKYSTDKWLKPTNDAVTKVKSPEKKEEMANKVADTIKSDPTPNKQKAKEAAAKTVASNVPGFKATSDGKITPNNTLLQATENNPASKKKVFIIAGVLGAIAASVAAAAIIKHKKNKKEKEEKEKNNK